MVRISGKFAVITAVTGLVAAALVFAQVPVIPDAPMPASPKPAPGTLAQPGTLAKDRVAPGTLATTPAQTPIEQDPGAVDQTGAPIFRGTIINIVAPVTVTDQNGQIMNNIQPSWFHLFDNGVEQDIHVDDETPPISLVVAIEASYRDDVILKQIRKIGSLLEPLITGTNGDAAVIEFDHRIQTLQDFTNDPDKLKAAVAKVSSGSSSSRMKDAVDEAVIMLRRHDRYGKRRRVILLISEQRDNGSVANGRQTLIALQLANVSVYAVDINQIARRLTEKPEPPRPDPLPPEAYNYPMGANTPDRVNQITGRGNSIEIIPGLMEIYTDAKAIFKRNPVEVFTQGTGGRKYSFLKEHGLEDAIADIGNEIHSQYLLSYNPKPETKLQGGFHQLQVTVDYPRARAKTKPGYWLAPVTQ